MSGIFLILFLVVTVASHHRFSHVRRPLRRLLFIGVWVVAAGFQRLVVVVARSKDEADATWR